MKITNKIKLLTAIMGIFFLTPQVYSQNTKLSQKRTLKRRVLLINFVNTGKNKSADYLAVTIPDAIIGHLQNSGKFEIQRRDLSPAIIGKYKLNGARGYNEESAIRIGNHLESDVVIIGNYSVYNNYLQVQTKAIDIHSGEVAVTITRSGNLKRSVYNISQNVAKNLTFKMAKKLGPIRVSELPQKRAMFEQRLALDEKKQNRFMPALNVGVMGTFPIGLPASVLDIGVGLRIGWAPTPSFNGVFSPYVEWNLWRSEDIYSNVPVYFNGIFVGTQYSIAVGKKVILSPYFLIGQYAGIIGENETFSTMALKYGVMTRILFTDKTALTITLALANLMDEGSAYMLELGTGFTWKF